SGVPRDLLKGLRDAQAEGLLPGVASLRPLILHRVLLPEQNNTRALVVGLELDLSAAAGAGADNPWGVKVNQTRTLSGAEYLFLTGVGGKYRAFLGADLNGALTKGTTTLKVKASGEKPKTVAVYGTVDASGPATALGGNVVSLPLDDAATVISQPDKL